MEEYNNLAPNEKIKKFLLERSKKNDVLQFTVTFIIIIVILFIASMMILRVLNAPPEKQTFILITVLLSAISLVLTPFMQKNSARRWHVFMRKIKGLPPKPELKNYYSTNPKDIRIINAKFTNNHKYGYIFGKEKKILIETKYVSPKILIEGIPLKGEEYFIICLESFNFPIAAFKGYYDGKEYLTWDCK